MKIINNENVIDLKSKAPPELEKIKNKIPQRLYNYFVSANIFGKTYDFHHIIHELNPGIDHLILKVNFNQELTRVMDKEEKINLKKVWEACFYNEELFYKLCSPVYKKQKWWLLFLLYRVNDMKIQSIMHQQAMLELFKIISAPHYQIHTKVYIDNDGNEKSEDKMVPEPKALGVKMKALQMALINLNPDANKADVKTLDLEESPSNPIIDKVLNKDLLDQIGGSKNSEQHKKE